jgi:NodT family efflux transporter outer membrane factor (OMF) lipoprotein
MRPVPRPALLVALGLVGCAVGPTYRPPEAKTPARWSRLDGSMTNAGAAGDLSRWWRRLNDPLLSALVDEALRQSFDLRKAQAKLRESRARRAVADAARFPTVEATASASRTGLIASAGQGGPTGILGGAGNSATITGNQFSAGFDASWEVDVFGGVRRGVEAAVADTQSTEASLQDTRVSLVAEVARSYAEVRSLQIRLGIARSNLTSQTETLALTEYRASAGIVSAQDAEQARANREQTAAQIPSLELSLAEAEHRLDLLVGQPPGTLHARLAGGGPLPEVPAQVAVGIPADALRQRPDVRAAERTLAAETARVGVAEAARYPSFKLSAGITLDAMVQGGSGNTLSLLYSLLGGVTAPIFQAGRLRNLVTAQDAVREQALWAYQQAVLTALQDVENALAALARSRERADALTRAVAAARNAAVLARQRYGAGVIDFQSVLDTERTVLTVEDSLASTRADGVYALVKLYKAMGGGWSPQPPRPAGKDAR